MTDGAVAGMVLDHLWVHSAGPELFDWGVAGWAAILESTLREAAEFGFECDDRSGG